MRRRLAVLVMVASVACGGEGGGVSGDGLRPLTEGSAAPAYEAETLDGQRFATTDGGGPLLVNIWATWCVPCREEMPVLEALHDELGGEGLRVVAVSIDGAGGAADIRRFLDEYGITFPVVHDAEERVTRAFRTTGVPESFLLAGGRVVKRWRGPVTRSGVEAAVQEVAGGT